MQRDPNVPPYYYLIQVAKCCATCSYTYLQLWRYKNAQDQVIIYKSDCKYIYGMSATKFRNNLMRLADEGLLSVTETSDAIKIEMTSWEEMDEEWDERAKIY